MYEGDIENRLVTVGAFKFERLKSPNNIICPTANGKYINKNIIATISSITASW